MDRRDNRLQRAFHAIVLAAVVVGSLIYARPVLMPLAFGVVFAFAIAPLVRRLEQWRVPPLLAVVLVIGGIAAVAGGVVLRVGQQLVALLQELPDHTGRLKEKITSLSLTRNSTFDGLWRMYDEVSTSINQHAVSAGEPAAVAVREVSGSHWALGLLQPVLQPVGVLVFVTVLIVFLLIERVDVRDRALAVAGTSRIAGTTRVLGEVGGRLGRYLFWLCVTNFSFGALVGVALYALGVPYALTWATLTGLFRFVPFVGSPISMLLPFLMALVALPGWVAPLGVVAVFGTLEFVSNNYVEPYLIGRSIGLNTVGVIVAILFWSWAWGATGLVLALPLTLTCVVFGKHVPGLAWINTLFGIDPPLPDRYTLYQRLMAGDTVEAAKMLASGPDSQTQAEAFDRALAPALVLARNEFQAGSIDQDEFATALETARAVMTQEGGETGGGQAAEHGGEGQSVNVIAADHPADEALADLVAQFVARWCSPVRLGKDDLASGRTGGAGLNIVCLLPRQNLDECIELCDLIREQGGGGRIIVLYCKPLSRSWKLQDWLRARTKGKVRLATGIARLAPMVRHFCERPPAAAPGSMGGVATSAVNVAVGA